MSLAVRRETTGTTDEEGAAPRSWHSRYGARLRYSDLLVVLSAVFGAQLVWVRVHRAMAGEVLPPAAAQPHATWYSIAIAVAWLAALALVGSRDPRVLGTGSTEYRRVLDATLATFGGLAIVVYLLDLRLARGYFLIALPFGLLGLAGARHVWRRWLCAQRRAGDFSARVVIGGGEESVVHLAREFARLPEAGYRVLGVCLPAGTDPSRLPDGVPVVGELDRLVESAESLDADTVVISSADELSPQRVREVSWRLEPGRRHLIVAPALTDIGGPRIHTRPVAGLPLVHVETPRYRGGKLHGKRIFDAVAAAGLLLALAPVLAVIAAVIATTDPGPVLFRQRRIGKDGEAFSMLKFRTMVADAEARLAALRRDLPR